MSKKLPSTVLEPLSFEEFLHLIEVVFKLYGRNCAQKEFEKYKHMYYNVSTDVDDESDVILKLRPTIFQHKL